eukprot:281248_1
MEHCNVSKSHESTNDSGFIHPTRLSRRKNRRKSVPTSTTSTGITTHSATTAQSLSSSSSQHESSPELQKVKKTRKPTRRHTLPHSDLSEVKISDDTLYWYFTSRCVEPRDLGHLCRDCKKPFLTLSEDITIRRGGRLEFRYHSACFSGTADPRTQEHSTFHEGKWRGTQHSAPKEMYRKMRTTSHW